MLVGVISDTHGLLRAEAVTALDGVDLIIHAGDVGNPAILDELAHIAPVRAIRGNVDKDHWAERLPVTRIVEAGEARFYVIHDVKQLDIDPAAAGLHAVIYGHSHEPSQIWRSGVLFLNPGSAGPRRFNLPITLCKLRVSGIELRPELIPLH